MNTIVTGSNAVAFFFGLNWDRIVFLAAVVGALALAALVFSLETGTSVFV